MRGGMATYSANCRSGVWGMSMTDHDVKERRVPTGWWFFGATVIDDKGRPFRFQSGSVGGRKAAQRTLWQEMAADPARPRPNFWSLLTVIITGLILWQSWNRNGQISLSTLIGFGVVGLLTIFTFTVRPWTPVLTGSRIAIQAAGRLQARKCPACEYDLPLDATGKLVTCPECGAAWKLNAPLSERVPE